VAEEPGHAVDIHPFLVQVGGEGMSEDLGGDALFHAILIIFCRNAKMQAAITNAIKDILRGVTMRQVIIYPGEDLYWVAECPSLPGCISQGETKEEAIANIKEAIQGYVAALKEDGLPVPEERFETLVIAV